MPKERRPHRLLRKAERCVQVLQRRRRHLKPTPCNYFTCLSNAAVEKDRVSEDRLLAKKTVDDSDPGIHVYILDRKSVV